MRSALRRVRDGVALAAAAVLLTACGGGDAADEAAGSSAATSSAGTNPEPDLASGLLPADAFGPSASVTAIPAERLQQGAGMAATSARDLQVTPAECAVAVEGSQPTFDRFDDVAAQGATNGSGTTVEVLVRGGPTKDTVGLLEGAAERCPQAQVSSPAFGQATISFESLPVDDLGDGAAMLRYTTAVTLPDGTQAAVPALIGAVQDADRLLVLMNLQPPAVGGAAAPAAPTDPAVFAGLLRQAFEVQADALG
jgi:hypothetical protein